MVEVVYLLVVALPDHAALTDKEGRLVHNGGLQFLPQLREVAKRPAQPLQQRRGQAVQQLPDAGHFGEPHPQGLQILAVGVAVDDAADEPLQIRDLPEGEEQLLPHHQIVHQIGNGVQSPVDLHRREEGTFQPLAQLPAAHGGAGLVQHPEETAFLLFAP